MIRGAGCPLAALTGKHPAVCLAMESLVTEVVGVEVTECCDRTERPKCCFEIKGDGRGRITARAGNARNFRTPPQMRSRFRLSAFGSSSGAAHRMLCRKPWAESQNHGELGSNAIEI